MYSGRLVFSQIMDFMPLDVFHKCVKRYRGNYKIQNFSCLDQFRCMAFAQLTYRESLRDIEVCFHSIRSKLYHMGIRSTIARNTLANANRNRGIQAISSISIDLSPLSLCPLRIHLIVRCNRSDKVDLGICNILATAF